MLSKSDVLGAIDLQIDYLGGASSIAEHGHNLVTVNQYELCAEKTLEQYEWWPMVHCMYGLQNCLNYNASAEARANNQTAEKAERGVDDDLELSGDDVKGLKEVECSLTGVVDFCASKHTSTDLATLTSCVESDGPSYAKASDKTAQAANGGVPLWVKVNNQTISRSTNENKTTLESWAYDVLRATCTELEKASGESDSIDSCSERRL
jgi:hypothetical protein